MPNGYIDKARRADPRDRERRKVCDPPPRHSLPFLPPSLHPLSLASILCLLSHYLVSFLSDLLDARASHICAYFRVSLAQKKKTGEEDFQKERKEERKRKRE